MKFLTILIIFSFIRIGSCGSESAELLDVGEYEVGLFQPLRMGYSENLEFASHPLLMFVIPNLSIKIKHKRYDLSTRHRFIYPTPLMRIFQKKGMFGLVTTEADVGVVPHMFAFQNEIFKSILINKKSLITFKGGFTFSIISNDLDERLSVDLPIIYPSMGEFFNGYKLNIGSDIRYNISNYFDIFFDFDTVIIPNEDIFWGSKLIVEYEINDSWNVLVGSKLTYGHYPFGKQSRMLPLFDIIYNLH